MALAKNVAVEFRKLADSLDKNPEAEVNRPFVSFSYYDEKERFLATARLIPRPIQKSNEYEELAMTYRSDNILVRASIPQSNACKLVTPAIPAVYECDSILSPSDEEEMEKLDKPSEYEDYYK
jgi:hypothetical protein